ncbi:hypothetical protein NDU88_002333 [Pleurodeles waltl]|uniref:Uncharacterized protein n=1 Tax=Pleurodeles waltl TaxID=8319 RepID=A0AAV7UVA1_PLEWA|nr:hypothetical protein NDU88_002333 [Pleurodeles waltl]
MATANADGVGNPLDGDAARSTPKALLCTHSNQLERVNEASTSMLGKRKCTCAAASAHHFVLCLLDQRSKKSTRLSLINLRRRKKNAFRKGPRYGDDLAASRANHSLQGQSLTDAA